MNNKKIVHIKTVFIHTVVYDDGYRSTYLFQLKNAKTNKIIKTFSFEQDAIKHIKKYQYIHRKKLDKRN